MHEVKRYDGKGNLIEVISAEQCLKKFWENFSFAPEITEEQIQKNTRFNSHGLFHLITRVKQNGIKKTCKHCGRVFIPSCPYKLKAKYCFKPGVPANQQCRRLAYREKIKKNQRNVICAVCKKPFKTHKKNAKYCRNPECNRSTLAFMQTAGGRYINCHFCGVEFKTKLPGNQKYCVMPYFVSDLQCRSLATDARKRQ